jgi:integrase
MGVYRRGKNWYIDFYTQGRRVREKVGPNKKLTEKVLNKVKTEVIENRYLDIRRKPKVKFDTLVEQYLQYAKANKRSWNRDEFSLKSLAQSFSGKYLYEINPYLIESYKTERRRLVSPATVNRELACLKHILTKAVEWEMIQANPAKKVRLFVENNKRIRYLTEEEIHRLYQNASGHLKPIIITALLTGMRRNEILKLKWEDIDFDHRIIFVRNTKNNEMREVPMNDALMVVLKSFRFNSPYVFVREDGKPYISIRTGFESALRRAGISDFRFHDLRHTFASHLIMKGVDLMTVKEFLGHKTIDMTLRYAYLSPDHKRHAVETLGFFDSHNLVTNESGAEELEGVSLCKVRDAKVAELADALDLGSSGFSVRVRIPPFAPIPPLAERLKEEKFL